MWFDLADDLPQSTLVLFYDVVSGGSHGPRGMRINSYDPDETPGDQQGKSSYGGQASNQRSKPASQRVATISNQHNEKTMLLSSDDEFQWSGYWLCTVATYDRYIRSASVFGALRQFWQKSSLNSSFYLPMWHASKS